MKLIVLALLATAQLAIASEVTKKDTLVFVTRELPVPQDVIDSYAMALPAEEKIDPEDVGVIFEQIVNIGSQAWDLISRGFHDPSFQSARAHALPKGLERSEVFNVLSGFKGPAVHRRELIVYSDYINGRWVAKTTYDVVAYHSGHHQGQGKYLVDVHVKPVGEPRVRFTWDLDVSVSVNEPFNMADANEDPLAAMQVNVSYEASAPHDHRTSIESFLVRGDGQISLVE